MCCCGSWTDAFRTTAISFDLIFLFGCDSAEFRTQLRYMGLFRIRIRFNDLFFLEFYVEYLHRAYTTRNIFTITHLLRIQLNICWLALAAAPTQNFCFILIWIFFICFFVNLLLLVTQCRTYKFSRMLANWRTYTILVCCAQ